LTYQLILTPRARGMLKAITDRRIREKLASVIDSLASEPELRGKPLDEDLAGYRSIRAVGQRYRIIYRVDRSIVTVVVVAAGIRKEGSREDIYRVAGKLIRLGLL
jgi:mRNA interferase RelE/StbE